jgi:hypothetical protein
MAKSSALAALDAAIKASQENQPNRSWFSRLPKEAQREFGNIRAKYVSGEIAHVAISTIYRAIVNVCKENGWQAPKSPSTIQRWLK